MVNQRRQQLIEFLNAQTEALLKKPGKICTNYDHSAVKVRDQFKQTPIDSPVVESSQPRSAEIVTQFAC
jgi:hypothetical protein